MGWCRRIVETLLGSCRLYAFEVAGEPQAGLTGTAVRGDDYVRPRRRYKLSSAECIRQHWPRLWLSYRNERVDKVAC
ncbi:unnamed protein product [Protopolystoma xenopodis]|uniref:Uncharacterized protein n=1 Tax=Protopolystoma xenopodis TaxID=117903 RepID=A0A3S5BDB9_9PLAT|nr:unnamed protein product [Protopolystoma xenopodis]